MKRLLLCITALFMCLGLTACGETKELVEFQEGDVIRVGMECAYAPFNWTLGGETSYTVPIKNTGGYADGYDVQVAKYIAEELNCTLEIYALAWDSLILELKTGSIDLIIAGMSPTSQRAKEVTFSDAYYTAKHVVLTQVGSDYVNATQLSDFADAKAVCQVNTVYDALLSQLPGVNRLTAKTSVGLCVVDLTNNVADISIVELPVAKSIIAANPSLTYVELTEEFVLEDEDKFVSIAMTKGNIALQNQINTVLATLSELERTNIMNAAVTRQQD